MISERRTISHVKIDSFVVNYKIPKIIQDYVIKQNFVSRNVSRKRYS